jgi:hypothetical protein
MKYGKSFSKLAISIGCILIIIIIYGCNISNSKSEGFAIYLTREDIPPSRMEALRHVDLLDQPIISVKDIITYNAQTHEMKLTSGAFDRIYDLDIPVTGKSFMVCVNKEPIYCGAFWTPISSISFDGVTIMKPYNTREHSIIVLELGYPSSSFYDGEDPRNNDKVLEAIQRDSKLVTKLTLNTVDKLPYSMKEYELYSWVDDNQWHFTLITGTNRNKTMKEIVADEDFISEIGWVNIHVLGVDAIKDVLIKLPQGESVFWFGELHNGQTIGQIKLQLPPKPIVDVICEQADRHSIDLHVTVS